ncbi:hypothetical protein [Amniculibacterium sp. G2-70]|nr:hypothetical protein [Amniculibacterium sp. G2-70]
MKSLDRLLHEKEIVEWQLTFAKDREVITKLHQQLVELKKQIEIQQQKQ